jgi:hypothetical protein
MKTYRILRTNQRDPYDREPDIETEEFAAAELQAAAANALELEGRRTTISI